MATTNRGFAVPEGGDDVDIPGDLVSLTNSIIPSMTTAAIAALSWADKPAGWLAYDTTLGKIVKSTGGSMVELTEGGPYLPSAGGTLIGGSASGSTDLAGYLTKTVIAPPAGKSWSVACNGARADIGAPLTVVGIPTSSTQVTFTCHWANAPYQGAVQILYHLIAY